MIDHNTAEIDEDILSLLGIGFCETHLCLPLEVGHVYLKLALVSEYNEILFSNIQLKTGKTVIPVKMNEEWIKSKIVDLKADPDKKSSPSLLDNLSEAELAFDENSADIEDIQKYSQSQPVVNLVNNLINQAIDDNATDIHIECLHNEVAVRFRKDGMLRKSLNLPLWVKSALISRLKIIADLDISEKRLPQDGRINWTYKNEELDMRVSSLPTRFGEKIVMRILKYIDTLKHLDNLNMPPHVLNKMKYFFTRPQGMIFVTGPTGSGKSSTLFAGLQHIIHKEINVSTIEDPIEYHLHGANQVQINDKAGLTFAKVLRSLLRQDPDVILVGEIRDSETAEIAVQASQTGHLVLSTLHTNDAISAITRLKDLGIPEFMIGNSVLCVLAQRLVRKVCQKCYTMGSAPEEIKDVLNDIPDEVPRPQGCKYCDETGYNGRIAVFEMLPVSDEIREIITNKGSESSIKACGDYSTLLDDGIEKMKQNLTTPEELVRVLLR